MLCRYIIGANVPRFCVLAISKHQPVKLPLSLLNALLFIFARPPRFWQGAVTCRYFYGQMLHIVFKIPVKKRNVCKIKKNQVDLPKNFVQQVSRVILD